jgi:hypothetical protein
VVPPCLARPKGASWAATGKQATYDIAHDGRYCVKPKESGIGEGLHALIRVLDDAPGLDISPHDGSFLLKAVDRELLAAIRADETLRDIPVIAVAASATKGTGRAFWPAGSMATYRGPLLSTYWQRRCGSSWERRMGECGRAGLPELGKGKR